MTEQVPPHLCDTLKRCLDDPGMPLHYSDKLREYSIRFDGVQQSVGFCPFCGAELPVSVRDEWFRRLYAMGLAPWEDELPLAYRSGAWWRDDPTFDDPRNNGYAITPVDLRQFVLAMGLTGPVPLFTIFAHEESQTDDIRTVEDTTLRTLRGMLRRAEIASIRDARDPDGRWVGSPDVVEERLTRLFTETGYALALKLPGFGNYDVVDAIAVETDVTTRAAAEAWVAENHTLWDMILADQ